MLKFFIGWKCESMIIMRKCEWNLFSYNFKFEKCIIGVIVARRWHWFGIINRVCGFDGYYDINGEWKQVDYSLSMKRWGWEYEVLIDGELKWLWHGEFDII